jgi:hypothetical protein
MALKYMGDMAPWLDPECTWCTGTAPAVLTSTAFASCVGLVLYDRARRTGVVAHYAGGLGTDRFGAKVINDTQEILRSVCPVSPGIWDGWIFGGESLIKGGNTAMNTMDLTFHTKNTTEGLINLIRYEIKHNKYIPINLLPSRLTDPEMQDNTYIGHRGVRLDLATGKVTWDDRVPFMATQDKIKRRGSGGSLRKGKPEWK